jgi:hypothetical protein
MRAHRSRRGVMPRRCPFLFRRAWPYLPPPRPVLAPRQPTPARGFLFRYPRPRRAACHQGPLATWRRRRRLVAMFKPGQPSPQLTPERLAVRQKLNDEERKILDAMESELGRPLTEEEERLALEPGAVIEQPRPKNPP